MKQNRTDQNCQRNGEHDAEASGKALHDRDTNVIGIDDLLIGKVIGVIQKKCADTASGECEDQVLLSVPIMSLPTRMPALNSSFRVRELFCL